MVTFCISGLGVSVTPRGTQSSEIPQEGLVAPHSASSRRERSSSPLPERAAQLSQQQHLETGITNSWLRLCTVIYHNQYDK